jgi:hypothetical protein
VIFCGGSSTGADEQGYGRAESVTVAHTAKKLDLVFLYLLAPTPPVAFLPAGKIPVHVPGDEPETRRDPVHQGDLGGTVGFSRRRKTEPHKRLRAFTTDKLLPLI